MDSQFKFKNKNCKFEICKNTTFGKNIVFGENCKRISIGFGCFLGNDIYIDVEELIIGNYTTIHHGAVFHGIKTIIGHNCWIGHYCIIDSLGGLTNIGNNVGIGAHSQLWSHMKFGDTMAGCQWSSSSKLTLHDDVWLVGHTIIGPITAEKKSMLLTGSVMMKDMEENKIYAGNPAKIINKLGNQFKLINEKSKIVIFKNLLKNYMLQENLKSKPKFQLVTNFDKNLFNKGITQFNLVNQTYVPLFNDIEHKFIKFMLYDKAKFIPNKN